MVADFIAVASRLVFLKSKYLLPGIALGEEEEADIQDLERSVENVSGTEAGAPDRREIMARKPPFVQPAIFSRARRRARGGTDSFLSRRQREPCPRSRHRSSRIFETIKTYELETRDYQGKDRHAGREDHRGARAHRAGREYGDFIGTSGGAFARRYHPYFSGRPPSRARRTGRPASRTGFFLI